MPNHNRKTCLIANSYSAQGRTHVAKCKRGFTTVDCLRKKGKREKLSQFQQVPSWHLDGNIVSNMVEASLTTCTPFTNRIKISTNHNA